MMRIKLKHNYRGVLTQEQWLPEGEYDSDDLPEGLAAYLVENDHAIVLQEATESPQIETAEYSIGVDFAESDDVTVVQPNYKDMKLDELRSVLDQLGFSEEDVVTDIDADWRQRQAEIVEFLQENA
jgi:hypothetical protein